MSKYLDDSGLGHLWSILKGKIETKQDALLPDATLEVNGAHIGVSVPTEGMTQAEYDALPETEKNKGLKVITDGTPSTFKAGMDIYSEEETVVGSYLGKPLYRRVVQATTPNTINTEWTIVSPFLTNCVVVNFYGGMETDFRSGQYIPFGYDGRNTTDSGYRIAAYAFNDGSINMTIGNDAYKNAPCLIVLEYTKTTDPEGSLTPLPVDYVHDYTTADGWHVRKYSDGYVEMEIRKNVTLLKTAWETDPNGYSIACFPVTALPFTLVERYSEYISALSLPGSWSLMLYLGPSSFTLGQTASYGAFRPWSIPSVDITCTLSVKVTGRWK